MNWSGESLSLLLLLGYFLLISLASVRALMTSDLRTPAQTLAWILSFFLLPVVAVSFFAFLGYRGFKRRKRYQAIRTSDSLISSRESSKHAVELGPFEQTFFLASHLAQRPLGLNARSRILHHSFESYGALADAIRKATRSIDLQYYIFQPDETGFEFRSLLIEAAQRGIQCRLLMDAVGSHRVGSEFLQPMRAVGIEVQFFDPIRIARLWSFHYRNHRKIAVIDTETAFIGSQNIGNEYLGWKRSQRAWKDLLIELQGDPVRELQGLFEADWQVARGRPGSPSKAFIDPSVETKAFPVQPIVILPTGPDESSNALEMVVCDLIARSTKEITLVTPYFVPSLPVRLALRSAVKRKVRTRILLPDRSDQWLVDRASHLFADEIRQSGAHVFYHSAEFLHAKLIVADRQVALMGSANMDERSFKLNWEVSALISGGTPVADLVSLSDELIRDSKQMSASSGASSSLKKVGDGLVRILTPLL